MVVLELSPLFSFTRDQCDGADGTLVWGHETGLLISALQLACPGALDKLGSPLWTSVPLQYHEDIRLHGF